jgi:hypothetical protein
MFTLITPLNRPERIEHRPPYLGNSVRRCVYIRVSLIQSELDERIKTDVSVCLSVCLSTSTLRPNMLFMVGSEMKSFFFSSNFDHFGYNATLTVDDAQIEQVRGTERRRCFSHLTSRWKQIQFLKRSVFWYLEFRRMGKVHKPNNFEVRFS